MPRCSVANDPSLDSAARDTKVKSQPGQAGIFVSLQRRCPAMRAIPASNFDFLVDFSILFPPLGAIPARDLLQHFVRSDEYFVPLVVEIGTLIDERGIRIRKYCCSPRW